MSRSLSLLVVILKDLKSNCKTMAFHVLKGAIMIRLMVIVCLVGCGLVWAEPSANSDQKIERLEHQLQVPFVINHQRIGGHRCCAVWDTTAAKLVFACFIPRSQSYSAGVSSDPHPQSRSDLHFSAKGICHQGKLVPGSDSGKYWIFVDSRLSAIPVKDDDITFDTRNLITDSDTWNVVLKPLLDEKAKEISGRPMREFLAKKQASWRSLGPTPDDLKKVAQEELDQIEHELRSRWKLPDGISMKCCGPAAPTTWMIRDKSETIFEVRFGFKSTKQSVCKTTLSGKIYYVDVFALKYETGERIDSLDGESPRDLAFLFSANPERDRKLGRPPVTQQTDGF